MGNLQDAWKAERPALVAGEDALPLPALMKLNKGDADNVHIHLGLRAILWAMCWRWSVAFVPCHNATYRKHFIGVGRLGERHLTKAAMVNRAHLMKLVPLDCFDEDRCDAVAVEDWACATYGQRSAGIKELYLTGEVLQR